MEGLWWTVHFQNGCRQFQDGRHDMHTIVIHFDWNTVGVSAITNIIITVMNNNYVHVLQGVEK